MRLSIRARLFLSHFLATVLVSGGILAVVYITAQQSLTASSRSQVSSTAALIGQTLDATVMETFAATQDASPAYQRALSRIHYLAHTTPNIERISVMRQDGNRVYWVLDANGPPNEGALGQEYLEHTEALLRGFQMPAVEDQPVSGPQGHLLAGYAPLRDGSGEFLVRVVMRADDLERKLAATQAAVALFLGLCILLALLLSALLSHQLTRPLHTLLRRSQEISGASSDPPGELGGKDELARLADRFAVLSRELVEARAAAEHGQWSLEQAKDLLEMRVAERTRDLMTLNERLLHEVAERARAEELLSHAARTDPLTGLMNRRAMLEQLEYQLTRFQRTHIAFTVLLGDLDSFKAINDTYGHDAGDQALIQTTQAIGRGTRADDLVARWGGEEFLVLLPDTDLDGGLVVAEALRARIAELELPVGEETLHLTISIGVAAYRAGQTLHQCIKAADLALYQAKLQGRNRVLAASTPTSANAQNLQ